LHDLSLDRLSQALTPEPSTPFAFRISDLGFRVYPRLVHPLLIQLHANNTIPETPAIRASLRLRHRGEGETSHHYSARQRPALSSPLFFSLGLGPAACVCKPPGLFKILTMALLRSSLNQTLGKEHQNPKRDNAQRVLVEKTPLSMPMPIPIHRPSNHSTWAPFQQLGIDPNGWASDHSSAG
jgi:hypothetical protein